MHPGSRSAPAASLVIAGLLLGSLGWPPLLAAQPREDDDLAAPPFVAAVDGDVSITRDGALDEVTLHLPLLDGDRLQAGDGGRLEIRWADGRQLWLDAGSTLDLVRGDLVRLVDGRLRVRSPYDTEAWRVETAMATVRAVSAPDVIVAVVDSPERQAADVAVVSGAVRVVTARGEVPVGRGQRVVADAFDALPVAESWDLAWRDAFLAWADTRVDEARADVASAEYLPESLRSFGGTLERYGEWQPEATYGHVWYPAVDASWAPYTAGAWQRVGFYGSVWIGADPWAWPTHHYGRWGLDPVGRWFWIPARRWSPGWVSWVVGPGYVGWAPLGWYDRPVIAWGSWGVVSRSWHRPYVPWRGWTVVPSHRLWSRGRAGTWAVDVGRFSSHQYSAFVAQRVAPKPGRIFVSGGRGGVVGDGPRDAHGRQRVPSGSRFTSGAPGGRPGEVGRDRPVRGRQSVAPAAPGVRDGTTPSGIRRRTPPAQSDGEGRVSRPAERRGSGLRAEPPRVRPNDGTSPSAVRRRPPGASSGEGRTSRPADRAGSGLRVEPQRVRPNDGASPAAVRPRAPGAWSGEGRTSRPADRAMPRVDRGGRPGGAAMARPSSPRRGDSSVSRAPSSRGGTAARGGASRRPPR